MRRDGRGRYRWIYIGVALLLLAAFLLARGPQAAQAHPLGNFTINRYSRIELAPDGIYVRYVVDMAEIPAFQEIAVIDSDRDGQVGEAERERYLEQKVEELRRGLRLSINGAAAALRPVERELGFPPGQGGLATLRLSVLLRADMPRHEGQEAQRLDYSDTNYAERRGWREIVVLPGDGISLLASSVPQQDRSRELRTYPQDPLASPPTDTEAHATFVVLRPASAGQERPAAEAESAPAAAVPGRRDAFASLVSAERLSLPVVVLSLLAAIGLGALHAISPGHGKTIMAAYLVGTRGTALHAVFLGLTVTVSHTLGVLALGLVTLYASHLIAPEELYPWLGLASGAIIIGIGLWLLASRLREGRRGLAHASDLAGWAGIAGHHTHVGNPGHSHPHPHAGGAALRITWRNLTALGVAGGLLPSASALVVLLAAISLNRVGFGILLIVAFSAGMAAVLSGVGLLLVYAGRVVERFGTQAPLVQRGARLLPLATGLVVLASGLVVTVRAALQMGLL